MISALQLHFDINVVSKKQGNHVAEVDCNEINYGGVDCKVIKWDFK